MKKLEKEIGHVESEVATATFGLAEVSNFENQPGAWIMKDGKLEPDLNDEAMKERFPKPPRRPLDKISDVEKKNIGDNENVST